MRISACFAVVALMTTTALGQTSAPGAPLPDLGSIKAIHVAGYDKMLGPDLQIAMCLMQKLQARAPFTFPDSPQEADVILTWTSSIPGGFSRQMWSSSPRIDATLAWPNGRVVWTARNRFRKSTTLWGASADIPCGLANGLVNKLLSDMEKQRSRAKRP
jgi:hypothetical protein